MTADRASAPRDEVAPPATSMSELMNQFPAQGQELPPLQKVGYKLALFVLGTILLATLAIVWLSLPFPVAPKLPEPLSDASLAQYKQVVEIYKQLNDVAVERLTRLFQQIVITALLPSFTAILGYVFGSRKND